MILTITPASISSARPNDDILSKIWYLRPTNKPTAPKISNTIIENANFSNPKRLNSFSCKAF